MFLVDRTLSQLTGWWMFQQGTGVPKKFGETGPGWHSLQITLDHDGVLLQERFSDGRRSETRLALDGSTRYALMHSPEGHMAVGQRQASWDRAHQQLSWTERSELNWARQVTLRLTPGEGMLLEITENGLRQQVQFRRGAQKPLGWRFWQALPRLSPMLRSRGRG